MPRPQHTSAPRYRRRILTVGLIAALALFSIGFPIFNNRIEDDLERRVPAELAQAGFPGITASFSGQDGTLQCAEPLDDPEGATAVAYEVWGVRQVTLDRVCRVSRAPIVESSTDAESSGTLDGSGDTTDATSAPTSSTTADQQFATVAEALAGETSLSFLDMLTQESGLTETLADASAEPITFFAPTDAAFDALPADVTAQLRSDPDLLARVLARHVASGAYRAAQLVDGQLVMMDGNVTAIVIDGGVVTVDSATVVTPDVVTGNGVVHIIDHVLLPDGFEISSDEPAASAAASLDAGTITLSGVVASEVERVALLSAAGQAVGEGNVVDQLAVDPDTGLSAAITANLVTLVDAMPATLVAGAAGFDGTDLYVTGVVLSDAADEAMSSVAGSVGATIDLTPRPEASDADAAELEAALNEFVAANPVRFEPNSAVLAPDAETVLDQLAARALEFAGVSITVEGHTDSDGAASANLLLSQQRADAVREGLIARGLDAGSLTARGFGSDQPVLVDGVEDKDASRRVEFRIVATP